MNAEIGGRRLEDKFLTIRDADQRYVGIATFNQFKADAKELCEEKHKDLDEIKKTLHWIDFRVWGILALIGVSILLKFIKV